MSKKTKDEVLRPPGNGLAYTKITNENPLLIPIESAYEKYGFVESDLFNVEV